MNLRDVMLELATQLDTIPELNVSSFPSGSVKPPAAMVLWPLDLTYDMTYGRGSDRMTLQVVVVVGQLDSESTRDELSVYANGSGTRSIKQVLEAGTYTAFDAVRVIGADFGQWQIADTPYMAALFDLDIAGDGA